jgi:hypothetical protein
MSISLRFHAVSSAFRGIFADFRRFLDENLEKSKKYREKARFAVRALSVVATMTLLDVVFACYVIETAAKAATAAGAYAAAIIVLSGYVTRAYVDDKRMLWPAAAGAFIGTYVAVRFFQ